MGAFLGIKDMESIRFDEMPRPMEVYNGFLKSFWVM